MLPKHSAMRCDSEMSRKALVNFFRPRGAAAPRAMRTPSGFGPFTVRYSASASLTCCGLGLVHTAMKPVGRFFSITGVTFAMHQK